MASVEVTVTGRILGISQRKSREDLQWEGELKRRLSGDLQWGGELKRRLSGDSRVPRLGK